MLANGRREPMAPQLIDEPVLQRAFRGCPACLQLDDQVPEQSRTGPAVAAGPA